MKVNTTVLCYMTFFLYTTPICDAAQELLLLFYPSNLERIHVVNLEKFIEVSKSRSRMAAAGRV